MPFFDAKQAVRLLETISLFSASTTVVIVAAVLAHMLVPVCRLNPRAVAPASLVQCGCAWDGQYYYAIAEHGYSATGKAKANTAFFPLYPLLSRAVASLCFVDSASALLIISNAAFFASLWVTSAYVDECANGRQDVRLVSLALLSGSPFAFFFHVAYSESLFLLFTSLVLLGMRKKWPWLAIAVLAGAASGTRVIGVFLAIPVALHCFRECVSWRATLYRVPIAVALSCTGVLGYATFLAITYSEPFGFVSAQQEWVFESHKSFQDAITNLATLRPLWATLFDDTYVCHWSKCPPRTVALFNMCFWNPIVFLLAVAVFLFGAFTRRLTWEELILCILLLLVPYVVQGSRAGAISLARYSLVILPLYVVAAQTSIGTRQYVAMALLAPMWIMMACFAGLYSRWYWVF